MVVIIMFDFPVEDHIYLWTENDGDLKLYIFNPPNKNKAKSAILFFHGAGFSTNKVKPNQFQYQAAYFSSLGQVSICVEYRPRDREGLFSPIESIKHAKSAIRWVRAHSSRLGINPAKVVVAGASAGGYLSLCCAMIEQMNSQTDDTSISCIPNAVVIFNGGVDADPLIELFPENKDELVDASPIHHVRRGLPPGLLFHGTHDANIPHETVRRFVDKVKQYGNDFKLVSFEGKGHGFFNYGNDENKPYRRTLEEMEDFLRKYDFLEK